MPIEIKELVIRASVQDDVEGAGGRDASIPRSGAAANGTKEEQIVNRCVEQVMEIIRIQNER